MMTAWTCALFVASAKAVWGIRQIADQASQRLPRDLLVVSTAGPTDKVPDIKQVPQGTFQHVPRREVLLVVPCGYDGSVAGVLSSSFLDPLSGPHDPSLVPLDVVFLFRSWCAVSAVWNHVSRPKLILSI
jgi:hypothetical protein